MSANTSGAAGERYARMRLEAEGCRVVAANYHSRFGEIDLIAEEDGCLAFIEVKTRRSDSYYRPAEAVTAKKRNKLIRTAYLYLERFPTELQPRFDVIEIVIRPSEEFAVEEYIHYRNAFGLDG